MRFLTGDEASIPLKNSLKGVGEVHTEDQADQGSWKGDGLGLKADLPHQRRRTTRIYI